MARTGFLVRRVDRGTFLHLLRQTDEVDGGLFRRRHARMETLVRKPGAILRRAADADRKGHEGLNLEGNLAAGTPAFGAGNRPLGGPVPAPSPNDQGGHSRSLDADRPRHHTTST